MNYKRICDTTTLKKLKKKKKKWYIRKKIVTLQTPLKSDSSTSRYVIVIDFTIEKN